MEQGCSSGSLELRVKIEEECAEGADLKLVGPEYEIKHEEIQLEDTICPSSSSLLLQVLQSKILECLPDHWILIIDESVNFLLLSKDLERTTQRRVSMSFFGIATISVHRIHTSQDIYQRITRDIKVVSLSEETIDQFVISALSVVKRVDKYEVCMGCVKEEYSCFWNSDGHGIVDFNPYGELRYSKTFRSNQCQLLIHPSKNRCMECYKISELFRKRFKVRCHGLKTNAPNVHLTEVEKLKKIKNLKQELESSRRTISNLKKKIELLAGQGLL